MIKCNETFNLFFKYLKQHVFAQKHFVTSAISLIRLNRLVLADRLLFNGPISCSNSWKRNMCSSLKRNKTKTKKKNHNLRFGSLHFKNKTEKNIISKIKINVMRVLDMVEKVCVDGFWCECMAYGMVSIYLQIVLFDRCHWPRDILDITPVLYFCKNPRYKN